MTTLGGTNEREPSSTTGVNVPEVVSLPQTNERQEPKRRKKCAELREDYRRQRGLDLTPHNITKKIKKLDLFPEISKEVATQQEERLKEIQEYEHNSKQHPDETFPKLENRPIIPRFPTEIEYAEAQRQVEDTFKTIDHGDVWIFDAKYADNICGVDFIKISHLKQNEKQPLELLCDFLHGCKQFISPLALEASPDSDFMSAICWSPDITRLEILDEYRNEEAIESKHEAYDQLMEGAEAAGKAIWNMFDSFTNAAAHRTKEYLKNLGASSLADNKLASCSPYSDSPGRATASLAFPSNNFYTNEQVDMRIASRLPDTFAMMIPTFKSTGKIGLQSQGHRVENGQIIFPDVKIAIKPPPDTICRFLFQPHVFPHGS
ncbi:hypothetical protein PCANC_22518 [Puccinia coronata f. sp. avenae]|uniref:Tet-like 2OG-Fe(II) oxygenase domain-containing protein n=1 Tax=Puccinia coronata f. sp. avenae TaxID=200324 RepID=A0A2N5S628_9BASI|nr:hypothetical protein PCANC_22518 [Puccinia coronata f. sp. avenae]